MATCGGHHVCCPDHDDHVSPQIKEVRGKRGGRKRRANISLEVVRGEMCGDKRGDAHLGMGVLKAWVTKEVGVRGIGIGWTDNHS